MHIQSAFVSHRGLSVFALSFFLMTFGASAGAAPSRDAWITTKAKIALITTTHLSSNAVHVDTIDGRVILHGKVSTALQKQNAESVVRALDGVADVRNLLQVVAVTDEKVVAAVDDQIKDKLEKELKDDSRLVGSSVVVKSVDKGIVLLSGKTRSLSGQLAALECASSVPGVRGVSSEIKSANSVDEAEAAAEGSTSSARDGWITMTAKMALIGDGEVPALDVGVDTRNGNVTLFGIVPTAAAKAAAEMDTRKIDSVRSVSNELQIVATTQREVVDAKDEIVTRDVKTALKKRPELKPVGVTVKAGVARLTGKLPSGWRRLEAATLVRATPGVRSVENDLQP